MGVVKPTYIIWLITWLTWIYGGYIYTVTAFKHVEGGPDCEAPEVV
jgi:hypothetical protein